MNTAKCENYCPKCGSKEIEFGICEVGDVIYYPATCIDCDCEFKEYFTYAETEY